MPELDDMDAATLRQALRLVRQHTGIAMSEGKQGLLQTRLRRRMRALGIGSYRQYVERVSDDLAEVPAFVDVVTTHQTAFFRTPSLWQYFQQTALPEWVQAHPGAGLRIWSAAASTGEEACTIAMCCDDFRRERAAALRWTVHCTDISAAAIDLARQGCYRGSSASQFRSARPELFERYNASGSSEAFTLPPDLRATLQHDTHNLLQRCPWPGQFDFVFLRNVLIYFNGDELRRIVTAVLAALRPNGLLVVGEAESLTSLDAPLEFVAPAGLSVHGARVSDEAAAIIHVGMGLHAVTRGPAVLKATLGSCVGIALVWRAQGQYALAHCLLPHSPASATGPGARYVDQAVRTLLDEMQVPRSQRGDMEAHLCGGALMSTGDLPREPHLQVGQRNIEAAQRVLAREGLNVRSADLGGRCARRLIVDGADGQVTMVQVAKPL